MKCMNCGAPVGDLGYYCWDCAHGLNDESSVSTIDQDAAHMSEDAKEDKNQDIIHQIPEESQPTQGQILAKTFDKLQTRLYLARTEMLKYAPIFLGVVLLTVFAYWERSNTSDNMYFSCWVLVAIGAFFFFRSTYRYLKTKKALAEFVDEHAFIIDDLKASLSSDKDEDL